LSIACFEKYELQLIDRHKVKAFLMLTMIHWCYPKQLDK